MVPSESPLVTRHSSSSGTEAPRSRRPRPQVQVLSAGPQEPLPEGVYRLTSQAGRPTRQHCSSLKGSETRACETVQGRLEALPPRLDEMSLSEPCVATVSGF